jgi:hypothetical protein
MRGLTGSAIFQPWRLRCCRPCWPLCWSCARGDRRSPPVSRGCSYSVFLEILRILLVHEDLADLKMLAARADALHMHHLERGGGVITSVDGSVVYPVDNAEVYPVVSSSRTSSGCQAQGPGGQGGGRGRGGFPKRGGRGGGGQRGSQATKPAREAAGLCYKHYMFGQSAYMCSEPNTCTWQGNGQAGGN